MKYIKTAMLVFIGIMIIIQFIPAGKKNISTTTSVYSLEKTMNVPEEILGNLKNGCYDCHSNNTKYPWYSNIQPVTWWLKSHIEEGKEHLNFDEFGNLDTESRAEMMEEMAEVIEEHEMPMASYTWLHPEARFNDNTNNAIVTWLKSQSENAVDKQNEKKTKTNESEDE